MSKILIVEDEKDLALALAIRLRSRGHETIVTHDAMMGTGMAVREAPDLVLLDIAMPAGGGLKVAEWLRANPHTAALPIIFITASKQPETRSAALAFSPAAFFEKPFDSGLLLETIEGVVGEASVPT